MALQQVPSTITVRVARKRVEPGDIAVLDLVAADGAALPPFSAGAHIDVHLDAHPDAHPDAHGPGAAGGLVRQYSLCNAPHETAHYRIGVLRDAASRGGSQAVHDRVHEGSLLRISAPRNQFALVPGAAHSLLLAGGIGITPLLAMAGQLAAEGAAFTLHACARAADRQPFATHLRQVPWADHVRLHADDGPPAQRLQLAALPPPQAGSHLYVCGPQGFMDWVLAGARAAGWPEAQLHWEHFGATAPAAGARAFRLQLARSGRWVDVAPEQTALQALLQAGVDVPASCEQGVCGTCLTRVIDGQPEHRDQYLTAEEQRANDCFLPCCSRAISQALVLDL